MAKGDLLGTVPCPECGGSAQVKEAKNGKPYRWCPDITCNAQYFPKKAEAVARLLAKVAAPVTDTGKKTPASPVTGTGKGAPPKAPEPEPAPAVTVTRRKGAFDDFFQHG